MRAQLRPLVEGCAEVPDFRQRHGKRHPLAAILTLACCALLCGYRSYSASAAWGRTYGPRIAQALGFTHPPPRAATLHTIFGPLECAACEAKLGAWADRIVGNIPTASGAAAPAIGLNGKTLRGSKKQGAPGGHLLSALAHQVGLTLAQHAVADKTKEITVVETVLSQLVLQGRSVTMTVWCGASGISRTNPIGCGM